jgi:hypothetical protein
VCVPACEPEPERRMLNCFDHEKLDVYKAAIEFAIVADEIVKHLPKGKAYLADQLQRAGASIPLNIAEGAENILAVKRAVFIEWQSARLQNVLAF